MSQEAYHKMLAMCDYDIYKTSHTFTKNQLIFCFDGPKGSGKSTLIKNVCNRLSEVYKGPNHDVLEVHVKKQPSSIFYDARFFNRFKLLPDTLKQLFYRLDRVNILIETYWMMNHIRANGKVPVVFFDRGELSTMVFNHATRYHVQPLEPHCNFVVMPHPFQVVEQYCDREGLEITRDIIAEIQTQYEAFSSVIHRVRRHRDSSLVSTIRVENVESSLSLTPYEIIKASIMRESMYSKTDYYNTMHSLITVRDKYLSEIHSNCLSSPDNAWYEQNLTKLSAECLEKLSEKKPFVTRQV